MTSFQSSPPLSGLVDLHAHTDESDGTYTPEELVSAAKQLGLDALAITDHDTFDGYRKARPFADRQGLDLVRGIELNSQLALNGDHSRSAHVLAYFPAGEPSPVFLAWLSRQVEDRRSRNVRLIEALQQQGVAITLQEVERVGRSLTGRPHFARVLVDKGYALDTDDAFRRYIGEDAPTFVDRQSPATENVIQLVRAGGGIPVLAHPVRLALPHDEVERRVLLRLKDAGLLGLEIYHSEHSPELQLLYRDLAEELGLLPTGGSDFHGPVKPDTLLGTGRHGNVRVPLLFLDGLRAFAAKANHA